MSGPERLAGPNVVQQIKQACLDDDIHLSGQTQQRIVLWGVPRAVVIEALLRHVEEGRKIHIKPYATGGQGYHGSLLLDDADTETVYFEIKLRAGVLQLHVSRVWLQLHEHDARLKPLPR